MLHFTIEGHSVEAEDHSYKLQWKCKSHQYANRKRVNLQNKIDKANSYYLMRS